MYAKSFPIVLVTAFFVVIQLQPGSASETIFTTGSQSPNNIKTNSSTHSKLNYEDGYCDVKTHCKEIHEYCNFARYECLENKTYTGCKLNEYWDRDRCVRYCYGDELWNGQACQKEMHASQDVLTIIIYALLFAVSLLIILCSCLSIFLCCILCSGCPFHRDPRGTNSREPPNTINANNLPNNVGRAGSGSGAGRQEPGNANVQNILGFDLNDDDNPLLLSPTLVV